MKVYHTLDEASGWEGLSVYLTKEGEQGFYGIHATGMTDEDGSFKSLEAWINLYDEKKKFVASVSRLFGPIEDAAEDMIKDGYHIVEDFEDKNELP